MKTDIKCGVIGAGSWGTAISSLLAKKGYEVTLWARRSALAEEINRRHVNPDYLSDVSLPREVKATSDIDDLKKADYIIVAVPSHAFRAIVEKFKKIIEGKIILSLTKGLEKSGLRMSQVLKEVLGEADVAVLSGPNHAEEVIREVPSATVIASENENLASELQKLLMTSYFRVYTNPDVIGVELGGATKNIVAIAAGISDGLGYGDNTKASLMTRGLVEMMRLGVACGAHPLTYLGLSGVGDLIVTCTSKHSRNRYVGEEIGKGKKLSEVISGMKMVAEGVQTAPAVKELALKMGVTMPITDEVVSILYEGKDPKESVLKLMLRSPKSEMPDFAFSLKKGRLS